MLRIVGLLDKYYFQVTGAPLGNYCYGSSWSNQRKLWFQEIRDSSGHLCSNKSFM